MDILYYSNYCKHCQKIKEFIGKSNLIEKISAICIDKRKIDDKTGQIIIILENGKPMMLPPNIHSVPSLLIKSNFHVIMGDEIIKYFQPIVKSQEQKAVGHFGEPSSFDFNNNSISEQYTFYSDNLQNVKQDNFVNANHIIPPIYAEPDNYKSNKISSELPRTNETKKMNNEEMASILQQLNELRTNDNTQIKTEYTMSPKI